MIYDRLNNFRQYLALNEKFKTAFEFLIKADLKNLEDGKYQIQGDTIYANVQSLKTKPIKEKKWEVHKKYIDIQYVIKGEECMGYGILEDFKKVVEEYSENKDVKFLDGENYNLVNVLEGDFVIFYPNDVHAPMLTLDEERDIKKIIVKIQI